MLLSSVFTLNLKDCQTISFTNNAFRSVTAGNKHITATCTEVKSKKMLRTNNITSMHHNLLQNRHFNLKNRDPSFSDN
jgi:hypothetical protein